jgi:hypothetical protein
MDKVATAAIRGKPVESLRAAFQLVQLLDSPARRAMLGVQEFLIARVEKLRIVIRIDEHPPPHFHFFYQGQDAKFSIVDGFRLPGTPGLERYESAILDWWKDNRAMLIARWNRSRPATVPSARSGSLGGPRVPFRWPQLRKRRRDASVVNLVAKDN